MFFLTTRADFLCLFCLPQTRRQDIQETLILCRRRDSNKGHCGCCACLERFYGTGKRTAQPLLLWAYLHKDAGESSKPATPPQLPKRRYNFFPTDLILHTMGVQHPIPDAFPLPSLMQTRTFVIRFTNVCTNPMKYVLPQGYAIGVYQ